jgi:WXG100 family type VII secretion target
MSDIENLQHLSGQLRHGAQQFSTAAQTLRQQAQRLDWSAQDLASGVNAWAGQGSQNFTTAWNNYHQNTQRAASALDTTSQSLTKLAQKIDEAVEQLKEKQSHQTALAIGLGVLTVGLVVLDVLQLGLDPVTDAATVAVGSAEVAAVEGAEVAAGAAEEIAGGLLEVDAEVATELDEVVVDEVTESGDILLDEGGLPEDIAFDEEPVQGNTFGDGAFSDGQRLPYDPEGELIPQSYDGSCVASSCRMVLNDNGIEVPEAYVRDAANVDAIEGGYLKDVPDALNELGLDTTYTYEPNLTIDELGTATADGDSAIVSVRFPGGGLHSVVVDGIEDDMVLIRDPAGSTYKITVEDFLQQWDGKAVIPTP